MTPILVIKTANGFAVMEYSGEIPQTDLRTLNVASSINHSWRSGSTVTELLQKHFEPPEVAEPAPLERVA